jgi:hypothetical protein
MHVEGVEVFAHFGDELFTVLVTLPEVFIRRTGLKKRRRARER